jgi:hypothetical protein
MVTLPNPLRWSAFLLGAAVLLGSAACDHGADGNPPGATTASPSVQALAKRDDCLMFTREFEVLLARQLVATAGFSLAGKDPARTAKAVEDLGAVLAESQASVDKHLATATNPEFQAILTEYGEQLKLQRQAVDAAGQDSNKLVLIMVNAPKLQAAVKKIDQFCS